MKDIALVELYNDLLMEEYKKYRINSFKDLEEFSQSDLKKLLYYFEDILINKGIELDGEISQNGKVVDSIIGKINKALINFGN